MTSGKERPAFHKTINANTKGKHEMTFKDWNDKANEFGSLDVVEKWAQHDEWLASIMKEFSWFTFYLGEIILFHTKKEFKETMTSSILKLKDLKSVMTFDNIDLNEVTKISAIRNYKRVPIEIPNPKYNFDKAIQWENRLQTLREKSVAGINLTDALAVVVTNEEFRTLTDEQQRELIQAWLYPTNNDGEIDTRSDDEIREQLWNDDDSAEVAEEKHYAEMAKFFDENVMDMDFRCYLPFCSKCGKAKPDYIGIMKFSNQALMPITFAFCVPCRNALVQLQIQRTQSSERFGA